MGIPVLMEVTCMCGWQCHGTREEIVALVQAHGREAHGVTSSPEEILAIAHPLEG
jgi:predicted small metal-binding protein